MGDNNGNEHGLLDIVGKLDVTLGGFANELRQRRERENRRWAKSTESPRFIPIAGQVAPTSSFAILPVTPNRPDTGTFWYLRRLVIGGLTPVIVPAGRADVFVSAVSFGQITSLAQVALTDWVDQTATLPNIAFYGNGEVIIRANEGLHIVLSSVTSGQQYVAGGIVEVVQEAAFAENWGL